MKRKRKHGTEEPEQTAPAPHGKIQLFWGRGEGRVWIEGTEKILFCNEERVDVILGGALCSVTGRQLYCLTYASGAVEIKGRILSVGSGESGNADL